MEEVAGPEKAESKKVSSEQLLSNIVKMVGEEFVVMSLSGWQQVVQTIYDEKNEELLERFRDLKVPVIPVVLEQKEKSNIIMPNDTPKGDSKIIV